ncbi:MAG: tRNA (N6-isopentenyl adenosine(37)-C2)-methylthiotransferase MiaB [Deltaproteobacteria bacterium]|nr:tRNA (N6-isopentenyl adenosine(37)-C2)-methylthiotransferase MiaB [Deltaproteobacteria bacterium]
MKGLYIQTYGCQINQCDSDRMARVLGKMNYTLTDNVEEADLILLNTCSVRDKAEQKVYSALGRWRELKERKKELIIGVGGCVAQQEGEDLLRRVPHLDLVFGTHNIHRLDRMLEEVQSLGKRPVEIAFYRDPSYMEELEGAPEVKGPKAFVAIMQGCNKVCSFCVVPYVRGREISRPSDNIVREVRELTRGGVKEVMLLGQNVNSYGKASQGELTFPELLHKLNGIGGLERIRFTTSHPEDLSSELIEAYATLDLLCEHLHLPVQSGSDSVLQRMRRGYTRGEYMGKIQRLRDRCPETALSTDIIVGFPGETEEEFQATLEILQEVAYDEIYAFSFSPRPQTVAAKIYRDDVPSEIKKQRLEAVLNLQQEISLKKNRERIGCVEEILVEGPSKLRQGQIMGRTRTNRIVNAMGPESLAGEMVAVRVTGASANSLVGEMLKVNQREVA